MADEPFLSKSVDPELIASMTVNEASIYTKMIDRNRQLFDLNEILEKQFKLLKVQNKNLETQFEELEAKNQVLKKQYDWLMEQNNSIDLLRRRFVGLSCIIALGTIIALCAVTLLLNIRIHQLDDQLSVARIDSWKMSESMKADFDGLSDRLDSSNQLLAELRNGQNLSEVVGRWGHQGLEKQIAELTLQDSLISSQLTSDGEENRRGINALAASHKDLSESHRMDVEALNGLRDQLTSQMSEIRSLQNDFRQDVRDEIRLNQEAVVPIAVRASLDPRAHPEEYQKLASLIDQFVVVIYSKAFRDLLSKLVVFNDPHFSPIRPTLTDSLDIADEFPVVQAYPALFEKSNSTNLRDLIQKHLERQSYVYNPTEPTEELLRRIYIDLMMDARIYPEHPELGEQNLPGTRSFLDRVVEWTLYPDRFEPNPTPLPF